MNEPLLPPQSTNTETCHYTARPRSKRSFNTTVDASQLFDVNGKSTVTTSSSGEGAARIVEVKTDHKLKTGSIVESLQLTAGARMRSKSLERRSYDSTGVLSREERVDFTRGPILLPETTYPEVMLPFVLRWQPFDAERRSIHAWIVDRFVARVYCDWSGRQTITVPAGRFDTFEMVMYPDLNDWVSLGSMLTTLAKPLLPKYRMWFEQAPTRRVVRYEGPYGPPGAPEIVLELSGAS